MTKIGNLQKMTSFDIFAEEKLSNNLKNLSTGFSLIIRHLVYMSVYILWKLSEKTEKVTITNIATITKKAIIVLERIDNIEKKNISKDKKVFCVCMCVYKRKTLMFYNCNFYFRFRKVNRLCCNISHSTGLHRKLNKTSLKKKLQLKSQHHQSQATCRI